MFFLNPLDSNTINIAKDIFIIPTEGIKKITTGCEKKLVLQKPVRLLKRKSKISIPDKFEEKFMKNFWMSY